MSRADVEIAGSGLAELTCAWLLAARGHRVRLRARPDEGRRTLLLGASTQALLRSLWGISEPAELDLGTHALTHRRARWGATTAAPRRAQPAVVVDGARLAARLRDRLAAHHPDIVAEEPGGGRPRGGRSRPPPTPTTTGRPAAVGCWPARRPSHPARTTPPPASTAPTSPGSTSPRWATGTPCSRP